ncbi:MAG: protein kinase domain-containing protein [Longimicrobiales bacterium]
MGSITIAGDFELQPLITALADRYAIERKVASGGHASVFLAYDLKNDRHVALKVLRPELSAILGSERFLSEIRVTANLQHPHILPLFESGSANGLLYYVMPFVAGESLRDRLLREKQLSVEESTRIATHVASALDYAHRHGILHRDIKPENILLHEDQALVSDFGIALALRNAGGTRLTETGISMGSPRYMSPEQATGDRELDTRSDVYALGCVLYEMLAGEPPHTGPTAQAVMAKVLSEEPRAIRSLRKTVPAHVEAAIERALAKVPADRYATVADFVAALDERRDSALSIKSRERARKARDGRANLPRWAQFAVITIMVGLAAVFVIDRIRGRTATPTNVIRLTVPVPLGYQMRVGQNPNLAISPDGRKLAYETDGRLYLRMLDRSIAEAIPDTERCTSPFFSPNGEWLGLVCNNVIMRKPVTGGPPVKIADASAAVGGIAWGSNGQIVFAGAIGNAGLWSVAAESGNPRQITTVSDSARETNHMWPDVLPNGAVLYTVLGPSGHARDARLIIQDFKRRTRTVVAEGVTHGRYVSTGHLLYADASGTLLIQPFSLRDLRTTGPARAALAGVRTAIWGGGVAYALAANGTLAYFTGTEFEGKQLTQVDLRGRELRRFGSPASLQYPTLSPDGRSLALLVRSPLNDDIYTVDLATGRPDRFTFDVAEDETPVWSADGRRIAYSSAWVGEQRRVYIKPVNSSEPERLIYTGKRHLHLTSWSPDGRWLAFYEFEPRSVDVWLLNLDDTTRLVPVATTPARERSAVFSPDGKWVAYNSFETGRSEVYVVSFPGLGGKKQVSRAGGAIPHWSRTGQELFFFDRPGTTPGRMMMTLRVGSNGDVWQQPVPLFDVPYVDDFAVAPDASSFYLLSRNPDAPARELHVVVNWLQEVLAPKNGDPPRE